MLGRRPCPRLGPPAASRRAHEPCPAQMLWAPLPLPTVAPDDVLRLASSTSRIAGPAAPRQRRAHHRFCRPTMASAGLLTASATNAASRCRRLLGAMPVSVLRPIGRHITDRPLHIDCPAYGF